MSKNLFKIAKEKKIKYFLISFVDLFGVLRSKLVPARAIKEMQEAGAGFAGFAAWLDMSPADSDMFGIPDPDSLIQLPWNKEIGWLASDLYMDGKPVKASPRIMLKEQIKKMSQKKQSRPVQMSFVGDFPANPFQSQEIKGRKMILDTSGQIGT
mgnify:CR=1 FL=1